MMKLVAFNTEEEANTFLATINTFEGCPKAGMQVWQEAPLVHPDTGQVGIWYDEARHATIPIPPRATVTLGSDLGTSGWYGDEISAYLPASTSYAKYVSMATAAAAAGAALWYYFS
jgi:hypothetical protein